MPSLLKVTGEVTRALVSGVTDPRTSFTRKLAVLGGFTASGLRFAAGMSVRALGPRPERPFILWDRERHAGARSVREALSALDLDACVRPCPEGGTRFGQPLLPQLEDPNRGMTLNGARDIVLYLHTHYGVGRAPLILNTGPVRAITDLTSRLLTAGRGGRARPSKLPEKMLELWSFEASPYCHFARAKLCELELPYLLHNVGKGSPRRAEFIALSGRMQVPFLKDPNTGAALFESAKIEAYLSSTYG